MFAGYRHCKKCGKALMGLFDGALCEECEKEENSRMTNEEAIANINMIRVAFVDPVTKEQRKLIDDTLDMAIKALEQTTWIPVSERLPETDNENSINNYNVLLWVKNKSHPEREPQIYLGKLRHIDGDDGSGNFWGIETKPCDWAIWGWSYFNEPEVIAWMPLPEPYKGE